MMLLRAWRDSVFKEHCKTLCFPPLYILLVFIVEIKYIEATFAALIWGGCKLAVFCRCFLLFASHVCYSASCSGKPPLQVCNFTSRRFKVFLLHCCRLCRRRFVVCCFHTVVSLFLNCTAKVVQIFETYKQFHEKMLIL